MTKLKAFLAFVSQPPRMIEIFFPEIYNPVMVQHWSVWWFGFGPLSAS